MLKKTVVQQRQLLGLFHRIIRSLRTVEEVGKSDNGVVPTIAWVVLRVPLQYGDADHGAHHANNTDLQPRLTAESVEEEYRYPGRDEEDDADATGGEIGGFRVGDAAFLEQSRLSTSQH